MLLVLKQVLPHVVPAHGRRGFGELTKGRRMLLGLIAFVVRIIIGIGTGVVIAFAFPIALIRDDDEVAKGAAYMDGVPLSGGRWAVS